MAFYWFIWIERSFKLLLLPILLIFTHCFGRMTSQAYPYLEDVYPNLESPSVFGYVPKYGRFDHSFPH